MKNAKKLRKKIQFDTPYYFALLLDSIPLTENIPVPGKCKTVHDKNSGLTCNKSEFIVSIAKQLRYVVVLH